MRLWVRIFGVVLVGAGGWIWTRPGYSGTRHHLKNCGWPVVRLLAGIGVHDGSDCHSFAAGLVIFGACFAGAGLLILVLASDRTLALWHRGVEHGRRNAWPR